MKSSLRNPQKKYSENLTILKTLIGLSIPTILEQLLSTLLQYVDTAMVGQLGEQATASISVTTNITWLVSSIPSALATATLAMIAKAVGAKDRDLVRRISGQLMTAVIVIGAVLSTISIIMAPFIPELMDAEEEIHRPATVYFIIISVPLVFRTASTVFGAAIRAAQNTKTPMMINFIANMMNVVLNAILIYGCHLGVTGAAIGSAVSYTAGGILMYGAYKKNRVLSGTESACDRKRDADIAGSTDIIARTDTMERAGIAGRTGHIFSFDKDIIKELLHLSIPVLGTNVVTCLGYVFFAGMVSGMGTTVFAAHSIAVTAETIFYIPGYGLRTATSALVGLSYGEKDAKKLLIVSRLSVALTVMMMLFSGVLLYFTAYPLMRIFTSSSEAAAIGARMLRIVAFTEPFFGLMVVLEGILYGLGRTRYAFFVESGSMWGIRILFTFLCVKIWGLGLVNVWYCMIADNICKALLLAVPFVFCSRKILDVNR